MPAPSRGLCVYDIDFPQFWEGRAIDAGLMRQYPGAEVIPALAARLGEHGVDMVTADEYLSKPSTETTTVVLSNEYTRFTPELLFERRLRGALCVSGESPLVAWRFYAELPRTGVSYDHLSFFPGVRSMLDCPGSFHDFFWPNPDLTVRISKRWSERSLLTLINSNKAILGWPRPIFETRRPKVSLGRWYRALQANLAQRRYPWMAADLYLERLAAIRHFGTRGDFALFGRGWDKPAYNADARTQSAISSAWRGEIPAEGKLAALGEYKFSLCYENTMFPGYITEKIFDCLCAGTIPVYLGAPDVEQYIAAGLFIDRRDFESLSELEAFLRQMTEAEADAYLAAARTFLSADESSRFTQEAQVELFATLVMDSLERVR